jgi:hypothetical protein|nr:MAG TPA: TUBULIN-SPECIFIC CHAPERONE, PUTATIVE PROTEIN [Crassvirales sp.]
MDNIEEIIDADVREKAVEDMATYKVGDVVWVIPEKRFGIIEDRNLAKDTNKVLYRVRIAPQLVISCISEKCLSRPPHLRK